MVMELSVLNTFFGVINLTNQIRVFINGAFFVDDCFLAHGFHKSGLDLAFLKILKKTQGYRRLADI